MREPLVEPDKLWDPSASAVDHLARHLAALCETLQLRQDLPKFDQALRLLVATWEARGVREIRPNYILGNDGTPAEFSLVSERAGTALRLAVQSYLDGPTDGELQRFRGFLGDLSRTFPLDLSVFDRLAPLLDRGQPQFGLQCEFRSGGRVPFKVYASVDDFAVFEKVLGEWGISDTAEQILRAVDPAHDSCRGIAIPLGGRPHCQLYLKHRDPVVERVRRFAELGNGVVLPDLEHFLKCLCQADSDQLPHAVKSGFTKIYVPVEANARLRIGIDFQVHKALFYGPNGPVSDGEFLRRMLQVFEAWEIPSSAYVDCVTSFARSSLDREYLIHDAFGYQEREPGQRSIAIYLSPRMFVYQPDRLVIGWDAARPPLESGSSAKRSSS